MTHRTTLAAALAAFLALVPAATPLRAAPDLDTLVDRLDAPSFEQREQATLDLAQRDDITEDTLIEILRGRELTAEQRARVLDAHRHRFARAPRAGMGISFAGVPVPGVAISRTIDEFPAGARGIIRDNDIITRIDGIDLAGSLRNPALGTRIVRLAIISRRPGETVPAEIFRPAPIPGPGGDRELSPLQTVRAIDGKIISPGRTLEVEIPLGAYDDLGQAQPISRAQHDAAWRIRLEREGISPLSAAPVLRPQVSEAEWNRWNRRLIPLHGRTFLAAADVDRALREQSPTRSNQFRVARMRPGAQPAPNARMRVPVKQDDLAAALPAIANHVDPAAVAKLRRTSPEIAELFDELHETLDSLRDLEAQMTDAALTAQERALIKAQQLKFTARAGQLREKLSAQLAEAVQENAGD